MISALGVNVRCAAHRCARHWGLSCRLGGAGLALVGALFIHPEAVARADGSVCIRMGDNVCSYLSCCGAMMPGWSNQPLQPSFLR